MPQSLMGIFGRTQVKPNMAEFSAECHSMDCSGNSIVFTELQITIRSKLLFWAIIIQDNLEEFE